jgi:hypothetical protein
MESNKDVLPAQCMLMLAAAFASVEHTLNELLEIARRAAGNTDRLGL